MANKEQLAILKQGVAAWNTWREENPDAKIDLCGAKLIRMDLSRANFRYADITKVSFYRSILNHADFTGAILGGAQYYITDFSYSNLTGSIFDNICIYESVRFYHANLSYTSWRSIFIKETSGMLTSVSNKNIIKYFNVNLTIENEIISFRWVEEMFKETTLADYDVFMLLVHGLPCKGSLKSKNLKNTNLVNFDLRNVDLRETKLMQADLRGANITGAKLYGSAREGWIIDGIRCEYIYWDEAGEVRTPPDRDFRPGEFEELYKQLPSFEYVFAQGFTPLDPLIMDRVVQAINEQHKEFSLELVNFDKRGEPHATFTVCRLDYVDAARKQIEEGYERNRIAPEQQEQFMGIISKLLDQNQLLAGNQSKLIEKIPTIEDLKKMGDKYINYGQTAAMGKNASASGNTFQQITAELSLLHEAMRNAAANPAQHAAADEVAKAEQAAKQQDEPKMRQHLKKAGKFAWDCTQKIGAEALSEYLKKMTLGM